MKVKSTWLLADGCRLELRLNFRHSPRGEGFWKVELPAGFSFVCPHGSTARITDRLEIASTQFALTREEKKP